MNKNPDGESGSDIFLGRASPSRLADEDLRGSVNKYPDGELRA